MKQLLQEHFGAVQGVLLGAFVLIAWFVFRPKEQPTQFRTREADVKRKPPGPGAPPGAAGAADPLAHAKMKRAERLALPGITLDGPPHEILGVPEAATKSEIERAYKKLMKQYHPDTIGRPGSREWQDAQKIAAAINQARQALLDRAKR
jgi:hypothetical protein